MYAMLKFNRHACAVALYLDPRDPDVDDRCYVVIDLRFERYGCVITLLDRVLSSSGCYRFLDTSA